MYGFQTAHLHERSLALNRPPALPHAHAHPTTLFLVGWLMCLLERSRCCRYRQRKKGLKEQSVSMNKGVGDSGSTVIATRQVKGGSAVPKIGSAPSGATTLSALAHHPAKIPPLMQHDAQPPSVETGFSVEALDELLSNPTNPLVADENDLDVSSLDFKWDTAATGLRESFGTAQLLPLLSMMSEEGP